MKKIWTLLLSLCPLLLFSQGIGLKAGLNFANITNGSDINSSSQSGFNIGVFLAPPSKSIISSRTEINYSRQDYSYKSGTSSGNVNLDYLVIPQFLGINITRFVQLQFGAQMAFLLNAKADSSSSNPNPPPGIPGASIISYYNKIDYGFGAGVEIHPVLGLLIGARFNISLNNLYKDMGTGQMPGFSSINAKNNLLQIYAGWTFGNNQQHSKKKDK